MSVTRPRCEYVEGPYCTDISDTLGWGDAVDPKRCWDCWNAGGPHSHESIKVRNEMVELTVSRIKKYQSVRFRPDVVRGARRHLSDTEYRDWTARESSLAEHQEYARRNSCFMGSVLNRMPPTMRDAFKVYLSNPLGLWPNQPCVLVGNGPSLTGLGSVIDRFPIVVRMNEYRLGSKWELDTGSRTSVWATYTGTEKPIAARIPHRALLVRPGTKPRDEVESVWNIPAGHYAALVNALGAKPSMGLLTASWLLKRIYPVIWIAGFDHFRNGVKHHYWDRGVSGPVQDHDSEAESAWFREMERLKRIIRIAPRN